jgi:Zn-finger nucleic acid-binding protein
MSNREGIEIDYCPTCRGVWLDRGELDKIIERSTGETSSGDSRLNAQYTDRPDRQRESDDRYRDDDYRKRKRKGLLGDLFDFD